MKADAQLLAARANAEATRIQLMGSIAEAKERLDPRTLAEGAVASAKARATDLAEDGVEAVRERPAIAALAAAGAALLLIRRPLARWFKRRGDTGPTGSEQELNDNQAQA